MNADRNRKFGRRIAAVVAAGSLVGVAGAMSVAATQQRPSVPDAHMRAEQSAIARWAAENGLSGLSPASLSRPGVDEARIAEERRMIVEWAITAGVSGLSPASAQPIGG